MQGQTGPGRWHPDGQTEATRRAAQFIDSQGNFRSKAHSTTSGSLYITADTGGTLIIIPPNADPGVSGALWNNGGAAAFSA